MGACMISFHLYWPSTNKNLDVRTFIAAREARVRVSVCVCVREMFSFLHEQILTCTNKY